MNFETIFPMNEKYVKLTLIDVQENRVDADHARRSGR
jgi:hypothetical protein